MHSALVLGGGGVTGIAWELGVLVGLHDAGADVTTADTVVGTSAGATVAVQAATPEGLAAAFAAQFEPSTETRVRPSPARMLRLLAALALPGRPERRQARLGRLALRARPLLTPEARLADIRAYFTDTAWPDRDLRITAVEAETGRFTVFDRTSGVDLVLAVAASRAVPLMSPPVAIGGRHYVDGGMRSATNADVATGADVVLVLAPQPGATSAATSIRAQLAATGAAHTTVVSPDAEARAAMGRNPFDLDRRADAARAGRRQAAVVLPTLRHWPVP
jgi:NTE family protein